MAGPLFKGRSQTNCQCFIGVAKRFDGDNLRFTFSQCPGFIKYDGIKRTGALQRIGITNQNPKLSSTTHTGNNRHWCSQAQRTRAGNNQYGSGNHQRINNLWCRPEEIPDCRTHQRNDDDDRNEH